MLKHGDFMDETRPPTSKSWSDIFKDPTIPLLLNAPAGNDDNLCETWTFERSLCCSQGRYSASRNPRNLQVIPNTCAKLAVEEQMSLVFNYSFLTKNAIMVLSNILVPSQKHVFSVDYVMKDKPSKEFVLRNAFTFPNPTRRVISIQMIKS
jgi:hypothetical protein